MSPIIIRELKLSRSRPRILFPVWKRSQLKITFLPSLLQCAVIQSSRVIVVIEHSGDWSPEASDLSKADGLTVNDVALDVELEAESHSRDGEITSTWLRTVDKRTGLPLWSSGDNEGFRCCLIRVTGWSRNSPPKGSLWEDYLNLFSK
jgi:hypothetical protein